MEYIKLCDSDYRFMCVVWEHAPVNSGELVKLCLEKIHDVYGCTENVRKRIHCQ
jgi:hypothetical protein